MNRAARLRMRGHTARAPGHAPDRADDGGDGDAGIRDADGWTHAAT